MRLLMIHLPLEVVQFLAIVIIGSFICCVVYVAITLRVKKEHPDALKTPPSPPPESPRQSLRLRIAEKFELWRYHSGFGG